MTIKLNFFFKFCAFILGISLPRMRQSPYTRTHTHTDAAKWNLYLYGVYNAGTKINRMVIEAKKAFSQNKKCGWFATRCRSAQTSPLRVNRSVCWLRINLFYECRLIRIIDRVIPRSTRVVEEEGEMIGDASLLLQRSVKQQVTSSPVPPITVRIGLHLVWHRLVVLVTCPSTYNRWVYNAAGHFNEVS